MAGSERAYPKRRFRLNRDFSGPINGTGNAAAALVPFFYAQQSTEKQSVFGLYVLEKEFFISVLKFWLIICKLSNMEQNYSNHKKFYAPHHFIFLPLLMVLLFFGIWNAFTDERMQLTWILFATAVFLILYLALMVRQHYALGNQNRIVRLEFKQRYFELTGKRSDQVENKLTFDQIAALRFAYDDEFLQLLERTLEENLTGDAIKKAITKWRPDHHRV